MKAYCYQCRVERDIPFRPEREDWLCEECGKPLTIQARERKPLERKTGLKSKAPRPPRRPKPIAAASPAQRAKIAAHPFCVACGVEQSEWVTIDPAHLTPRGRGGCDDALCVLGLCRTPAGQGCHRLMDDGHLDLLIILTDRYPAEVPELQHMLEHMAPVEMVQRLANARTQWSAAA